MDVTAADGLTPLHIAAIKNHGEITRMLLAAGSHINYKTHEKATCLHFAASRGFLDMVNMVVFIILLFRPKQLGLYGSHKGF